MEKRPSGYGDIAQVLPDYAYSVFTPESALNRSSKTPPRHSTFSSMPTHNKKSNKPFKTLTQHLSSCSKPTKSLLTRTSNKVSYMTQVVERKKDEQEWVNYRYDENIERILNNAKNELSKSNYELLTSYNDHMIVQTLAKATRSRTLQQLSFSMRNCGIKKDWKKATQKDVEKFCAWANTRYGNSKGGETNSSYDCKKMMRIFLRWVFTGSRDYLQGQIEPLPIRTMRMRRVKDTLVRADLTTREEVDLLLDSTQGNLRNHALISIMTECPIRPGELLSLRIQDVVFSANGLSYINVVGKSTARRIFFLNSIPSLSNYMQSHPDRFNREAPLWIMTDQKKYGQPMSWAAVRMVIKRLGVKCEINKALKPNHFRHYAATEMAQKLPEAQLRKLCGWSATSKMPARYVHMISEDVETAMMNIYGIKQEDKVEVKPPITCQICSQVNEPENQVCRKCARPLSMKAAVERDDKQASELESLKDQVGEITGLLARMMEKLPSEAVRDLEMEDLLLKRINMKERSNT